ncbi:MAG TPA: Gfo/Idh/MocA family oxidoreductase [Rhodothermales bacterium]|nr:Gfo/Idh/MocA family oxidoreductase [Rhodothermales bacterium]
MTEVIARQKQVDVVVRPRLGFVGVGWIGRNRMEALAHTEAVEIAGIADPVSELAESAHEAAPEAELVGSLDELLEQDLDGIVIATPSALHAEQSMQALAAGMAVFCQKPLGRTAEETRRVVEAARRADRLLGVDLSYRHVEGIRKMREMVQAGEIGDVFAVDLVFHNAYGPDKPWFHDPKLAGGGCVIDLGIHLVDAAYWVLGAPALAGVTSRLFSKGEPLAGRTDRVEDYAVARLDLEGGTAVNLACSWYLSAGCMCAIGLTFYGTKGGLSLHNVDGSYFDFVTELCRGTQREVIAGPPDDWGGRAAIAWAQQLAESNRYDPGIEEIVPVAETLDRVYGRGRA